MRKFKVEFKQIDYRHYISLVITGIFLLITFLAFPKFERYVILNTTKIIDKSILRNHKKKIKMSKN